MQTPILHGQSVVLRAVTRSDQQKVFEGLSHPDVIKYYGVSYTTFEETAKQMDWYEKNLAEQTGLVWVIEHAKTNAFMGIFGIYHIDAKNRNAEIGYWLFPVFQGKGYASETLQLVITYASKALNLHRIYADVETENRASASLLLRNGFTLEGIKQDCEYKNGRFISLEQWAILFDN
ncbi:MAG: GNAT family N-acetyltransferase [Bacteroidia bacterium]|jgi:ribosomal-protein-alanine N-acetyltransferase|nr:GNAT family N-acetyltransferase [Bacteroidia bacterium]